MGGNVFSETDICEAGKNRKCWHFRVLLSICVNLIIHNSLMRKLRNIKKLSLENTHTALNFTILSTFVFFADREKLVLIDDSKNYFSISRSVSEFLHKMY